jgi:hypothetical protein
LTRPFALTALTAILLLGAVALAKSTVSADAQSATRIDTRINKLHLRLRITAAQEPLWQAVAQVIRDNAMQTQALEKTRADDEKNVTAVDDLRSYSQLIDAHADGVKRLEAPFEALYESMSSRQKHHADLIFRDQRHPAQKKS